MFDELDFTDAKATTVTRLQDYAADARNNSDVMAAVRLTRIQPVLQANSGPQSAPAG